MYSKKSDKLKKNQAYSKYHFIHDVVGADHLNLVYCPLEKMIADITYAI